jgi:hypothetical protein
MLEPPTRGSRPLGVNQDLGETFDLALVAAVEGIPFPVAGSEHNPCGTSFCS